MQIPPYIVGSNEELQIYNQDLNQTLQTGLGETGWTVPQITDANLRTNTILLEDGTLDTIANFMPNGTLWYVTDAAPNGAYVGKINGALVQFTTAAYP